MFGLADGLGLVMLLCLVVYCLSGGADFGGGVWDLLARGPRAEAQRKLVLRAIGPIWEANHVWLIAVIVLMFVSFPKAYAALGTLLHIPLTLMLVGIVLRGSAFIFRSYGVQSAESSQRWAWTFSVSSTVTPIMLGVSLGAVISGRLPLDVMATQTLAKSALSKSALATPALAKSSFVAVYVTPWLQPFPLALGLFVLALFAYLAAIYLAVEAEDPALQGDFRIRGLVSGGVVGGLAWLCLWLSRAGAPLLAEGLSRRWWSLPFQVVLGLLSVGALVALWQARYRLARWLAVFQVGGIVLGWGMAQYPYLIVPHLTLQHAAAPASVLLPVAIVFGLGSLLIIPAFGYLYVTFKRR